MRILMMGGSGLVGQGVLAEVLADARVSKVAVLGRRPLAHPDARVEEIVVGGFDHLSPVADRLAPFNACFYCAGAPPIGTPGARYRHVTLELTLQVARAFAARNPQGRFIYISGAMADRGSIVMPLRIKGDTEAALQALPISTVMLRPGGVQPVHGERSPHAWMRPFYALAAPAMGLGVRMMPGLMTSTAHIGRAMLALADMPAPPAIVENDGINRLGGNGDAAAR